MPPWNNSAAEPPRGASNHTARKPAARPAGAGGGVRGGVGIPTRTGTMVTATHMAMATHMAIVMVTVTAAPITGPTATAMAMVNMAVVNMAMPASPELPNYSAGCNAQVITTERSTECWAHKRGAQSGRTNSTTGT